MRPFLKELRASQLFEVFIQAHVELPAEARPPRTSPRAASPPTLAVDRRL